MFRYRLHARDGDDLGKATYAGIVLGDAEVEAAYSGKRQEPLEE